MKGKYYMPPLHADAVKRMRHPEKCLLYIWIEAFRGILHQGVVIDNEYVYAGT